MLVVYLVASLLCTGFGPPRLVGTAQNVGFWPEQIRQIADATRIPPITARAAILIDLDDDQTIWSKGADASLPPASTTKIMSALLVLERGHLTDTVTVPPSALVGDSNMGLVAGERLTLEDLLWGMLLPSGNDAAMAAAIHVAGSVPEFVTLMNKRAAELGLSHTHFVNPTGLDAPGHVSSASDLAVLAQIALHDSTFARMVATRTHVAAGHELTNSNELLGTWPGADGVKTGTTDAAGECLVATETRDRHRLLGVVLGSRDRYGDMKKLLGSYHNAYTWVSLDIPRDNLSLFRTQDGALNRFQVSHTQQILLPDWQVGLLQIFRLPSASSSPGAVQFQVLGRSLAKVPIEVVSD